MQSSLAALPLRRVLMALSSSSIVNSYWAVKIVLTFRYQMYILETSVFGVIFVRRWYVIQLFEDLVEVSKVVKV